MAKELVRTVNVRNDACERVIKLGQDYSNVLSKDSGTVRDILHVVEEVRKRVPGYSKK